MSRLLPLAQQSSSCPAPSSSGLPIRPVARRKVHCILPSSPWLADSKTNIPLGLLYIAAVLRDAGHDVLVTSRLDYHKVGTISLSPAALACDLHLIGFCTPQFGEALHLAATIKDANPSAIVVAGGPHPSYEPQEVKEAGRQEQYYTRGVLRARRDYRGVGAPLFDSVVLMEGEQAILQLLSDWDHGALQPYYYGDKSEVPDLDAVPFPAWDLLPRDHIYNDGTAMLKEAYFPNAAYPTATSAVRSLIGTRGCPYKCTYCSTPWIGQAPRYRSPANIVAELRQALDLGIRQFKFQDDTYTLHRSRLRDLALFVDAHLGPGSFAARIHTRVNTMSPHVAESLHLLNCRATCFGIESGSQPVLDANEKGTTVAQNTLALQIAHDAGFRTIAFLVLGMSGETRETIRETQRWLLSVKPYLDQVSCSLGIPYPGSRWWTSPEASGIEILDYNYDSMWLVGFSARDEVLVKPHGMTVDDLHRGKQEMFAFLRAEGWARSEWDEDVRRRDVLQEVCS
jgi:anaerobic magnesium-protoporphyrin IX monomethyl ester cyclase